MRMARHLNIRLFSPYDVRIFRRPAEQRESTSRRQCLRRRVAEPDRLAANSAGSAAVRMSGQTMLRARETASALLVARVDCQKEIIRIL